MQIGPKIDELGGCARIAYLTLSRFLDVANTSSMPHLIRNLILVVLFFYRTFYLVLKLRNLVKSIFYGKVQLYYTKALRRGVRSDAQLSCTENRFQKCSQSGKNGSKHPMLSISMGNNVISCKKTRKKHSKNQIR